MKLSGVEHRILWAAALGRVLKSDHDAAPAVGAAYRRLEGEGLLVAEWFGEDDLPLQVELTAAGRVLLRVTPGDG